MASWTDKLRDDKPHQVKPAPVNIAGMKKGQMMLVPSARIVDAFIRRLPKGRLLNTRALRLRLARRYRAEVTCPITTGFILRMLAEAPGRHDRPVRRKRRSLRSGACWRMTA